MGYRSKGYERYARQQEKNRHRRAVLSDIIRECQQGNFSGLAYLASEGALSSILIRHNISEEQFRQWQEQAELQKEKDVSAGEETEPDPYLNAWGKKKAGSPDIPHRTYAAIAMVK